MALALFDLDNTLVDRTLAFGRAVPWLAERYGLDPAVAVPFMIEADGYEPFISRVFGQEEVAPKLDCQLKQRWEHSQGAVGEPFIAHLIAHFVETWPNSDEVCD